MAHMNCSRFAADPEACEAVVARHGLHAQKALEALRRTTGGEYQFDDESLGPGWFDSSWELVNGLEVREGLPGDAGLHEWLAVCLAG